MKLGRAGSRFMRNVTRFLDRFRDSRPIAVFKASRRSLKQAALRKNLLQFLKEFPQPIQRLEGMWLRIPYFKGNFSTKLN